MTEEQQKVLDFLFERCFVMKYINIDHDQSYRCAVTVNKPLLNRVPDKRADGREFDITFDIDCVILSYIDNRDDQHSEEDCSYDEWNDEFYNEFIKNV